MLQKVVIINGQKKLVPLSGSTPTNEVAIDNMHSVTSNAVAEFIGNAVKLYDWNLTDRETIDLSDNILNYDIVFVCLGLINYSAYPETYSLCYPHDILDYILNNNKYMRLTGYDNYYVDYSIISSGSQLWRRASNSTITIYSIYGIGKRS